MVALAILLINLFVNKPLKGGGVVGGSWECYSGGGGCSRIIVWFL